jgi:hypothetical protein
MHLYKLGSILMAGLLGLGAALSVEARPWSGEQDVEIEIVDDGGRELRQYPLRGTGSRAYVEAQRGENYSIRVRNRSNDRVGLVIAVDGRNIISGQKSYLARDERKYILGPRESAVYEGWRTARDRVHRFYFTDAADSYAEAFGDRTAMGVIAVAVFPEKQRRIEHRKPKLYSEQHRPRADKRAPAPRAQRGSSQPGTGFGESEWSPSRQVAFEPQSRPSMRRFLKYEWRETLCRKGITSCDRRKPGNRFWPDDEWAEEDEGFAPYPARARYYWLKRELARASEG